MRKRFAEVHRLGMGVTKTVWGHSDHEREPEGDGDGRTQ
jgi:hypothetical protein